MNKLKYVPVGNLVLLCLAHFCKGAVSGVAAVNVVRLEDGIPSEGLCFVGPRLRHDIKW